MANQSPGKSPSTSPGASANPGASQSSPALSSPKAANAVLLIHCPAQRGLVAQISQFIFQYNGNIVHSDHHTDLQSGLFLMRLEWETAGFHIGREEFASA